MPRNVLLAILIVLALLGLADSWYLAQSAATDTSLVCDIDGLDGCNTVAQSPYSRVAGIPLADFGLLFYGALLLGAVALLRFPGRRAKLSIVVLTALGALLSAYFVYVQLALIQAVCIYCIASAIISWLSLPTALALPRAKDPTPVVP